MELIKKQIHYIKEGKPVVGRFYLDEDINVPDAKGDVRKIIYGRADVKAEEIKPSENCILISGKAYYQILYMTDEALPQIEGLKGSLPFEETVYVAPEETESFFIQDIRNELTCSLIHSRKISAQTVIEMEIGREKTEDEEAAADVRPDEGIYKKMKKAVLLQLHMSKKDTFRVKEEFRLSGSKEGIERILLSDISLRKSEMRPAKGALLLGGALSVFCIYKSETEKTGWIEQILPFEGRIECADISEDMYFSSKSRLEDARLEVCADEDGEMRLLVAEGCLDLRANIYREAEEELLEDMYSLKQKISLSLKESEREELLVQNHSKCKIFEQIDLSGIKYEILRICHSEGKVRIEHTEYTKEGLQIDGLLHISFIYLSGDDEEPFGSRKQTLPFSFLCECPGSEEGIRHSLSAHLEQLSVNPCGSGAAQVKAVIAFDTFLRKPIPMKVITEAQACPYSEEESEKRPGIVGYIVKEKDELWDLAKRYMTTVKRIQEVNALESEVIRPGQKLLILKESMTIL